MLAGIAYLVRSQPLLVEYKMTCDHPESQGEDWTLLILHKVGKPGASSPSSSANVETVS
jgi:hypothetical protein